MRLFRTLALLFPPFLLACGSEETAGLASPGRPVTVLELVERIPHDGRRASGVVEPYRATQVGFEVGGRVTFVRDVGQEVDGPLFDGNGELLLDERGEPRRPGAVIATIDDTRYRQAVAAIELKLASNRRQLEAQEVELERVASADLESARAQAEAARIEVESARENVAANQAALDLATSTVERNRDLVTTGAVSRSVLDQSEAEVLTARARLEQANSSVEAALQLDRAGTALVSRAEGSILLKEAQIEATRAAIAELQNELLRAQTDLDSCVLRAPFSGRITAVSAATGTFVQPGQVVATLVLMAPVKVVFTASAQLDRELLPGMGVRVFPTHGHERMMEEGVVGTVFEKGEVADPGTRTFRVGIMVRNPLLTGAGRASFDGGGAAPVTDIFPTIPLTYSATEEEDAPLFVNMGCVLEEDGEQYVFVLPNLDLMKTVERDLGTVYVPRRVRVELGDEWEQIDQWTLRSLADDGGLVAGQALVVNPTPESMQSVVVASRQWAFRPGDIVRIGLEVGLPPSGFWVPVSGIRELSGGTSVLRVEGDRAVSVPVSVHEASGELRRIESDALASGDRIVQGGVHYIADGDRIEVVTNEKR